MLIKKTTQINKILEPLHPEVKKIASALLAEAPEYFWTASASATGKYHPAWANGEGGLVLHSLRVAEEVHKILSPWEIWECFTKMERDCAIAAALVHDLYKRGEVDRGYTGKYTVVEHGLICARKIKNRFPNSPEADLMALLIANHMGIWGGGIWLPQTKKEYLLCYILQNADMKATFNLVEREKKT